MRDPSAVIVVVAGALSASAAVAGTPPADPGWLAKAQESIAAREYHASVGQAGLQAPNRAQDLRTHFGPRGIAISTRSDAAGAPLVEMRVLGVGRGRKIAPLPAGEVVSDGARVEIRRPGLVEWYENRPDGLEQGFTLARRPSGKGELRVALGLGAASVRRDGDGLVLVSTSGRELKYGGLVVRDARGAILPARFELPRPAQVEVAVDDRGASYPLLVDPIFTATADQTLSLFDNSFGASVAGNCDVNADGYADVIVGAPEYDVSATYEGAAFVFHGGPTGIGSGIKAVLHVGQAHADFGMSVACAGKVNHDRFDDVIVGAPKYEESLLAPWNEGAAFVFKGGAAGVDPYYDSFLHSDQAFAEFGASVAGAGDVNGDGYDDVIVGAGMYDRLARDGAVLLEDAGAAFVFLGGASGIPSGTPAQTNAALVADQAGAHMGGWYRYHWAAHAWAGGACGGVAGAGDVNGDGYDDVIVGAPDYVYAGSSSPVAGAAFVYLGGRQGIGNEPAEATLYGPGTGPYFFNLGYDVSGAGDVNGDGYDDVIVGGLGDWYAEALIFHGSPDGIASAGPADAASWLRVFNEGFQGVSVASAGDVNNDGHDDVIVGGMSDGYLNYAQTVVFLGTSTGVPSTSLDLPLSYAGSGYLLVGQWPARPAVDGAGDVNGDGYDDVIVGMTTYYDGHLGVVRVYHGGLAPGQIVIQPVP